MNVRHKKCAFVIVKCTCKLISSVYTEMYYLWPSEEFFVWFCTLK